MKIFSRVILSAILSLIIFLPTGSNAYEIISGDGTPMRTEIGNEGVVQQMVDRMNRRLALQNAFDGIPSNDELGVYLTRDERRSIRNALMSGAHWTVGQIAEEAVRRSLTSTSGQFLNQHSNELRRWTVINANQNPISINVNGFQGVTVSAETNDFRLQTTMSFEVHEGITAALIGIVLFDIWDEVIREVKYEWLDGINLGTNILWLDGPFHSRSEAERFKHALFFVDSVRFPDGKLVRQDRSEINNLLMREGFSLMLPN